MLFFGDSFSLLLYINSWFLFIEQYTMEFMYHSFLNCSFTKSMQVVSTFWLLQIKLLSTLMYRWFFFFSFLLFFCYNNGALFFPPISTRVFAVSFCVHRSWIFLFMHDCTFDSYLGYKCSHNSHICRWKHQKMILN